MRKRDNTIQLICAGVLAVCLAASGVLSSAITAEAGRAQLVYTDAAQEGDPPEVAMGIAMGAFRGLFVNYLWLRATRLKEEGKFYEAIELSSAITRLQPRFPRVWAFHAWNMAYNISVATHTVGERWQWVQAGINLLRSEGIPRNPNDILIYKELAWIFLHKIQGFSDDANRFYKRRVAEEWTVVLGEPPAPLAEDVEEAKNQMVAFLRPVAGAPDTMGRLIEDELEAMRAALPPGEEDTPVSSRIAELVKRLKDEAHLELDVDLLNFVAIFEAFRTPRLATQDRQIQWQQISQGPFGALYRDEQYAGAWDRLVPFVRRKVLINDYHMEPDRMIRYTRELGPFDWRHAGAHAVYWSRMGVEEALGRQSTTSFDTLNTDRITVHAIQEIYRSGTIIYDLATDEYIALSDFHFVDTYGDLLEKEVIARGGISQDPSQRVMTTYASGYMHFLRDVIRTYYRLGRYDDARKYLEKGRNWPYININDPDVQFEWGLPLEEFVKKQQKDRVSIPHVAAQEVYSSLFDAYLRGLLQGDMRVFQSSFKYASEVHRLYYEQQNIRPYIDPMAARMDEMSFDFREVAAAAFLRLLSSGQIALPYATAMYNRAPQSLRQSVYDPLRTALMPRFAGEDGDMTVAQEMMARYFPDPGGMEQFRAEQAMRKQMGEQGKKEGLEFEQQ